MGNNGQRRRELRSRSWFDNPPNPDMTALYLDESLNYGLSIEEFHHSLTGQFESGAVLERAVVWRRPWTICATVTSAA